MKESVIIPINKNMRLNPSDVTFYSTLDIVKYFQSMVPVLLSEI